MTVERKSPMTTPAKVSKAKRENTARKAALATLGRPEASGARGMVYERTAIEITGFSRERLRELPHIVVPNHHWRSGASSRRYALRDLLDALGGVPRQRPAPYALAATNNGLVHATRCGRLVYTGRARGSITAADAAITCSVCVGRTKVVAAAIAVSGSANTGPGVTISRASATRVPPTFAPDVGMAERGWAGCDGAQRADSSHLLERPITTRKSVRP